MSWDRKRGDDGPRYYYRSRRVGSGTVKEYVGRGEQAERAAKQDDVERQQRYEAKARFLAHQVRLAEAEALLDELRNLLRVLTEATLLAHGYHHHRGQWRRRRTVHG